MTFKVCPRCQTQNAVGNRTCIKCARNLMYEEIQSHRKKGNFHLYVMERFFSSLLVGCAVVSLFFALMAVLDQPAFMLFPIQ